MKSTNIPHWLSDSSVPPTRAELCEKHQRIKDFLDQNKLDGVLLATTTNIAWYTGGGEVHIGIASLNGACVLVITRDQVVICADAIEAPKLEIEALKNYLAIAPVPVKLEVRQWFDGLWNQVERVTAGLVIGTDDPLAPGLITASRRLEKVSFKLLGPDFIRLRYCLTPQENERYRSIGQRTAVALEDAAMQVRRGQSEFEIAALLNQSIMNYGLVPILTLIAADERIAAYRHPLPTVKTVDRVCMLVTAVRGGGLVCSATRLVHFGPLSAELRRKHDAVVQVDAALLAGSHPNVSMSALFDTAKAAYAEQGFPGEEAKHHQGGATGYSSREYKCGPQSNQVLHASQAIAWNPSIAGTKSEDTYLLVEVDGSSVESLECLSHGDGDWPLLKISRDGKTFYRPDILIL